MSALHARPTPPPIPSHRNERTGIPADRWGFVQYSDLSFGINADSEKQAIERVNTILDFDFREGSAAYSAYYVTGSINKTADHRVVYMSKVRDDARTQP